MCFLLFSERHNLHATFLMLSFQLPRKLFIYTTFPLFQNDKNSSHSICQKLKRSSSIQGKLCTMFFTFYYQINTYIASVPTTASPTLPPLTKYSCLDYVIIRKKAPTHSLMKLCIWSITHLQKCGTVVILMKICAHFFLLYYILHTIIKKGCGTVSRQRLCLPVCGNM